MNAFTSFLKKVAVIKGTVSVISSDPSCKDDNARFTMVSLKHMIKNVEDIVVFLFFQLFLIISICISAVEMHTSH